MRKTKTTLLLALLLCMGKAWADNKLLVRDVTVSQDGTAVLAIETDFDKDDFTGYQFDLTLPQGLSLALNADGKVVATSYTDLDIDGKVFSTTETTTTYRLIAAKMGNPRIPSGSYVLLSVDMESDGTLDVGEVCQCEITNITFSDINQQKTVMDGLTFNVTISDRVVLDENSAVAPAQQSGVNVLVKRTIKAEQWSTIVLPFLMSKANAQKAFGSDYQLAEFDGFVVDYGEDEENVTPLGITINLKNYTIPARGGWAAGKPLLIKVSSDIESFELDGVNISTDKVNDVSKTDEYETPGVLTGSFAKTTIPEDGLFISDNKFWYSTGKTTVKAFRCWFELGAVLNKETSFESRIAMRFVDDGGEATSIGDMLNDKGEMTNGRVYDLQGRRIGTTLDDKGKMTNDKVRKGLYIVNGKKFIK